MTRLIAFLSLFLLSGTLPGLQPGFAFQDPPDIETIKFDWSKERIGWEQNPFSGTVESFEEMRVRSRNEKRINDAKKTGSSGEVNRLEREARVDEALAAAHRKKGPARYAFLYRLTVKNTGKKTIKAIDWDYVFIDGMTEGEVGRQQFTSEETISPGKRKELSLMTKSPPTRSISVHALEKNERKGLTEQVILVRIAYADGTVWERP